MTQNLEIFRNIHKGQIGFVIAPGPSLAKWDINKIVKHGVSFACSSSIVALDYCDYFLLTDGIIPYCNYFNKAAKISKNMIFCGNGFLNTKSYAYNSNGYDEEIEFKSVKYLIDRRYDDPNSVNFNLRDGKLLCSYDVVQDAVHFAYVCGCDPIITIGIDLIWNGDERYFKKLEGEMIQRENSPYKYADDLNVYRDMDAKETDGLNRSYQCWVKIKSTNPNLNIKNTNPNGKLTELFETIDLKEYEKD